MPQEPILEPGAVDPVYVVPATTPLEPVASYEPTRVIPQVPYQAVVPPIMQPVAPVATGPMYVDDRRQAWPYLVAVLALVVGGLIGFLIGDGRHPDTTAVTSNTQPIGSTVDSTATSAADLQNQVDLLTAAQTQAAQDLADSQAALAQAQAERDALAAQAGTAGGATTGLQADLDASKAQVAKLQTELDAANGSLTQTQASVKTLQGQLDTANATLVALHPTPLPNYLNGPISKVNADAQANGWIVKEVPATTPSNAATGTVLEQSPDAGATVVAGSVIFVKVK